jgi:quercetin dioxygenase-like cupin family protein
MSANSNFQSAATRAQFSAARATKMDLFRGPSLLVGLNCFEPGQSERVHTHGSADKFYFVVSGKARITVGSETAEATEGDLVWAPAGVSHGVELALERSIILVGIAPPPGGPHGAAA